MKKYLILFLLFIAVSCFASQVFAQHDLYGLWAKRAVFGSGGSASISTSTVDELGNVYVAGTFTGTLNFSDDICSPLMRTAYAGTVPSPFVIKYDKNGKYQWDVVFRTVSPNVVGLLSMSLDYSNGKLLFKGGYAYPMTNSLPVQALATGVSNTKTISSPSTADGAPSNRYLMNFAQVIDCPTGNLESIIDHLPTGLADVYSVRIVGANIIFPHFGWSSIHPSAVSGGGQGGSTYSVINSYKLSDGTSNFLNRLYPNQPLSTHPAKCDGSRIRQNITTANGAQVFVHYSHDYTDQSGGQGIPAYYIMKYSADFLTHQKTILLTAKVTDSSLPPKISSDDQSNVYFMMNYGHAKFWNTQNDIPSSNTITDFLGISGLNFSTAPQRNKIILARVDSNLDYTGSAWSVQIGTSGTSGTDMVYGTDIKNSGAYTYLTGRFSGVNVPFGNGKTLSSNGGIDGFYAVYDNANGNCLYAVNMGGTNDESNTSVNIFGNQVLLTGNYLSPMFQTDPAGRLYPLSSNGTTQQAFITLYSLDPLSVPNTDAVSFGDAPVSYGLATHYICNCLRLGGLDPAKIQTVAAPSVYANTAENDDGFIPVLAGGFLDLTNANHLLKADKSFEIKLRATNSSNENAKLIAWIDFNRNGTFEADEASNILTIAQATANGEFTLQWTGAGNKMRNGRTYLRIRLTTDNLDSGQTNGLLFNGEVEDYSLNFDVVRINKTAVSSYLGDNTIAAVGDTVYYTLNVTNKIDAASLVVFDPIPEGLNYHSSIPAGTLTNITLSGQTIPAIRWSFTNVAANTNTVLKFKAVVNSHTSTKDSIYNTGYAVINGDTIPSTADNGDSAIIAFEHLRIVNDNAVSLKNTLVKIDIFHNDIIYCADTVLNVTVQPLHGLTAMVNDSLQYTPNIDFVGLDSLTYQITCGAYISTAKVYIIVYDKPDNIIDADCFVDPPVQQWSFKELMTSPLDTPIDNSCIPLVGDIDNDGKSEAIVFGKAFYAQYVNKIHIFEINNNNLVLQQTLSGLPAINRVNNPYAIAKVDGNDYAALFFCTSYYANTAAAAAATNGANALKLMKYIYNPSTQKYEFSWSKTYSARIDREMGQPIIVDFNGDGISEVLVLDKVFNARTGELLVDGGLLADNNNGFGFGGHLITINRWVNGSTNTWSSIMAVGDIDNDGTPEVIGGKTVYKVNINNPNTQDGTNTFTVLRHVSTAGHSEAVDGPTAIADMTGDGKLDVVVSGNLKTTLSSIYVWDPRTGEILHTDIVNNIPNNVANEHSGSVAFIGDIDNDGQPEICFSGYLVTKAYEFNPATKHLTQKWSKVTNDSSVATSIVMFDFDQDGAQELVYRDITHLRILNGVDGQDKIVPISCTSETANEYPVVVDINNDQAAEIVVTSQDVLRIFSSSSTANKWATTRKVWNQFAYNVVNVNNDLTIPKFQLNPATRFPGPDHILGTADDITPFNGYLQQQTALNKYGLPMWLAINAEIAGNIESSYDAAGDSLVINVQVSNVGDAAIQAPFYIAVYKNTVAAGTAIGIGVLSETVLPGETKTAAVVIHDVSTRLPIDNLIVRLNDNGSATYIQPECQGDLGNIEIKPFAELLIAHNDKAITIAETPVRVDVMDNDSIPATCTNPALSIETQPAHGTATIVNDSVQYIANPGFAGYDTVVYKITCTDGSSTAKVTILVHEKPDNIVDPENCFVPAPSIDFTIKKQATVTSGAHIKSIPLVGDLDGDGIPEIITLSSDNYGYFNSLKIIDGSTRALKTTAISVSTGASTSGWLTPLPMVLVDSDGDGLGEIIFTGISGSNPRMYCYEADLSGSFHMVSKWSTTGLAYTAPSGWTTSGTLPQPIVTDFNGDGAPELVVFNQIYNANTGALMGTTEAIASAYMGRNPNHSNPYTTFATTADMDGDGLPELIAGGAVYKVTVSSSGTAVTCKTLSKNVTVGDGFSTVADLDLDGKLEVVIAKIVSSTTKLYVWRPDIAGGGAGTYKDYTITTSTGAASDSHSFPFIGDIDGAIDPVTHKKYPEICITTINAVTALTYNQSNDSHSQLWKMTTTDSSGGTGITLFDFNNDGASELVYRDENNLRIVDGVTGLDKSSIPCLSGTAWEYPVIADTDGDGSANICATCGTTKSAAPYNLVIFESNSQPWAPTRKVWNQVSYEPLQINEDLT
ncbi:MAG: GEVED domain-containing protein, partial [Prevotellaceae bacterium]|nr:GEVED domain-containing protein [Prevotellaceae bacterium]